MPTVGRMYHSQLAVIQCHRSPKPALRDESEHISQVDGLNYLRCTVTTVLFIGKKSFLCRDRMTTFEATVPLGHRGWGTEENVMKTTDELLVVYSVYKRENDLQIDGAIYGEVGQMCLNATRVKSASKTILKL